MYYVCYSTEMTHLKFYESDHKQQSSPSYLTTTLISNYFDKQQNIPKKNEIQCTL